MRLLDRVGYGITEVRPSVLLLFYAAMGIVATFAIAFAMGVWFAYVWWSARLGWELMMRFLA